MTKKSLPAIHPGEFLSEALGELNISQAEFARAIGASPMQISHVIKGTRPVTEHRHTGEGRYPVEHKARRYCFCWIPGQARKDEM